MSGDSTRSSLISLGLLAVAFSLFTTTVSQARKADCAERKPPVVVSVAVAGDGLLNAVSSSAKPVEEGSDDDTAYGADCGAPEHGTVTGTRLIKAAEKATGVQVTAGKKSRLDPSSSDEIDPSEGDDLAVVDSIAAGAGDDAAASSGAPPVDACLLPVDGPRAGPHPSEAPVGITIHGSRSPSTPSVPVAPWGAVPHHAGQSYPAASVSSSDATAAAASAPATTSTPAGSPASTPSSRSGLTTAPDDKKTVVVNLVDNNGLAVRPAEAASDGKDIYFLGTECLYRAPGAATALVPGTMKLEVLKPPKGIIGNVPMQEFLAMGAFPAHRSIVILDKSGSVFEYVGGSWRLMRANLPIGSPDPHYIAIASAGNHVLLLDPERNQIWRVGKSPYGSRYFKDVLPWRIRAGDPNVTSCIGLCYDGSTYVTHRGGTVIKYPASASGGNGSPRIVRRGTRGMRPTRMSTAYGTAIFLVERENNRVCAIDKKTGSLSEFVFPSGSDLRGVLPGKDGFWVLNGSQLAYRTLASKDPVGTSCHKRAMDHRLDGITMPVPSASLPGHTGVFPGARRAYRYGVHAGLDFFTDPGRGTHVSMNTPALAAESGKVVRADVNYKDMDARTYSTVMTNCARAHYCSEANEDLFRGCQVWLDHGNGLVTRYAHLNRARADLVPGKVIGRGDTIGYIGVSGTGENLPGRGKHPHLHFETWLDDHYLGWGLNMAETMDLLENIFGRPQGKRGMKH